MATCPHCFKDKPTLSTHCPHCTHRVTAGQEMGQAGSEIVALIVVVLFLFWVFGG
jgi:flagellar biogenesis protein FliO